MHCPIGSGSERRKEKQGASEHTASIPMTNVGNRRRKSKSPSTSTSFVLLLVASLLFALTAAGAPDPTQPPRRQRLTTLDLAALEAPAPLPSPAALGKRYLLSPLSVGPSHAFVIARVARELVSRGASVLLLCPGSMRPFFDVPPPGVKTLSIEVGRGGKRGGGEGAEEEGGREPTEADFEDESVKWRTVHYNTSGELMRVRREVAVHWALSFRRNRRGTEERRKRGNHFFCSPSSEKKNYSASPPS